ncbi:MAG: PAS domain-containing sensor histidine kinase [Nitrospiraceae bacterium]|nr:MAG: PAS domain-containing sensor histidine kinase [Nitrospiraceae bacterium]
MKKANPADLRRQAEARLKKRFDKLDDLHESDPQRLIHELRVHQVELEMQNEELRKSQTELEESRARYSDLYDFAPVGYFTFDKNGLIIEANLPGAGQLGVERHLLIRKPFASFIHKDDQDAFFLHRGRVFEAKTLQTCELRLKRKSGEEFYAQMQSLPVGKSDGSAVCMTAVSDITALRQIREALTESEHSYRTLVDNALVGVYKSTVSGDILFVNNALAKMLEYDSPRELMSTGALSRHRDPEDRSRLIEILREKGSVDSFEVELLTKTGSTINVLLSATLEGDALSGMLINITRRKKAEAALHESKQLIELLLDSIPYPTMLIRRDRTILAANKIAREAGALVGEFCWQSFGHSEYISDEAKLYLKEHYGGCCPPGIKCSFCLADETTASDKPANCEVKAFGRLWDTYWIPVKDDVYLHYGIDITERKKAEEERGRLLEALKISNTELEQFAYIASHDLLEPLRMVTSYLDIISKRYRDKLDKDAGEFIDYAAEGAVHMKALLNDLLMYSRVGSKGKPFELTDLNISLRSAISNLKKPFEESGAQITCGNLPGLYADETQMVQLFQNLIGNAIKFRGNEAPRINVSSELKDNEWIIKVSDNGIGIDPKFFDKIFLIFQRLHTKEQYPGTGIGLSICKKIVERHGGRIWVESEAGKGATFYFTIPVKRPS